ncbi:MAG: hypothetical protein ACYC36_02350 [Bellilinea sp.]
MAGREVGVVRKRLSGEAAAPYMGIARTQLGILKEAMSFQGLQQLQRTVQLSDGTQIFVSSIFGQDTIRIDTPTPAAPEEEAVEAVSVMGRRLYVAGERYDLATAQYVVCRWEIEIIAGAAQAKLLDIAGIGSGLLGYTQLSMSTNGDTIVWAQYDTSGATGGRIYKWSQATGAVLLARDTAQALTFLASKDGGTVVWQQADSVTFFGNDVLKHTDALGTVKLGTTNVDTGQTSAGGAHGLVMAEDGSAVAWNYGFDTDSIATSTYAIYRWAGNTGVVQIATPVYVNFFTYLGISADGNTVAWVDENYLNPPRMVIWSTRAGVQILGQTDAPAPLVMVAKDGAVIYWSSTGEIQRWSVATGLTVTPLVGFSPIALDTGASVSTMRASADGTVVSWVQNNTPSGSESLCYWHTGSSPMLLAEVGYSNFFNMSADGGVITWLPNSGNTNGLYRWVAATGALFIDSPGSPLLPSGAGSAISPDGNAVAWQAYPAMDTIYRWAGGVTATLPAIDPAAPRSTFRMFTPDSYVLGYSYSTAKAALIPTLWMPDTYLSWDGYKVEAATAAVYF